MIGSTLGQYRLDRELGAGGMGKVYAATTVKKSAGLEAGEVVALKVVHSHLMEAEGFFKRFLREGEIGRRIRHPSVVATYDVDGINVEGRTVLYLAMEYVEGQTLRSLLTELGRVPEELCRHIGREVAAGLAAIHGAGVVHRDLKPENVLITKEQVVKVMDLGVARLVDEVVQLSQTGAFVGSLHYAAPEQFRGPDTVDERADLHALGLVLHELATGRHPFGGGDVHSAIRQVLSEVPRRCSETNPQLTPYFDEVVATLLRKDPAERFPSAAELLRVLTEGEKSDWWRARAQAIRAETHRPLRRVQVPRTTALCGRDAEVAKLRAVLGEAKAGRGQVVLVEGEPGIGKTRLVDEFVALARQGGEDVDFLFGSYPPGGAATASGAFSTAYREHFGDEGLEDSLRSALTVTPALVPAFAALLRGEPPPTGAEPLTKDSIQTLFIHVTRALSKERPTVVLIDDLQWAPEEGRALFTALAMAIAGHRVLLFGALREGQHEEFRAGVTRLAHATSLRLGRLGPKDLTKLLVEAMRSERLAAELGFPIAAKSDGNPFFVFEILRALRDANQIAPSDAGTWVRTGRISDIEIPSTIRDLVEGRLASVAPEDRDLLDVASCCGFEFDPLLVGEALGLGRIPALKRLAHLERSHRLVRSTGQVYVFDHHQVHEAIYQGLAEPLRREYHAAIAETLERREGAADRDPEKVARPLAHTLCDHFLRAHRGEKALRYLSAARQHLDAGNLPARSADLAGRALELPGLLTGEARVRALRWRSWKLHDAGHGAEALAAAEEAVRAADALGDPELRWRTRFTLAPRLSAAAERLRLHEEAERIATESGDRLGALSCLQSLSFALIHTGRYGQARECIERVIAGARELGDADLLLQALYARSNLRTDTGEYEEALADLNHCIAQHAATGDLDSVCSARANRGYLLQHMGRFGEARADHEAALERNRATGDRPGEMIALSNLAEIDAVTGAKERSRRRREETLALAREMGDRRIESYQLHRMGEDAQNDGDPDRADGLYREALALRRELTYRWGVSQTLAHLGGLDAARGRRADAVRNLDEALATALEIGQPDCILGAAARLAALSPDAVPRALDLLAAHDARATHRGRMLARFNLWRATGDRAHLAEAHRLLVALRDAAPQDCLATVMTALPLHREIAAAAEAAGL